MTVANGRSSKNHWRFHRDEHRNESVLERWSFRRQLGLSFDLVPFQYGDSAKVRSAMLEDHVHVLTRSRLQGFTKSLASTGKTSPLSGAPSSRLGSGLLAVGKRTRLEKTVGQVSRVG